jgi:hypothetical protein
MLFRELVTYKALDKDISFKEFTDVLNSIPENPKITDLYLDNFEQYVKRCPNKIFAYADSGKGRFRIEIMPRADQGISLYHIECGGFDDKEIEFVVVDYAAAIIKPEHFDNKELFLAYAKKLFIVFFGFFNANDLNKLKEDYETIGLTF